MLADIVIPKDERSGSATDAKAPEFMDFMLAEKDTSEATRVSMRGGLAWLDNEMRARFGEGLHREHRRTASRGARRHRVAGRRSPNCAAASRGSTASASSSAPAFFSSQMGWQDLRYMGNVFNPGWNGCPPTGARQARVSYEESRRIALAGGTRSRDRS